MSKKSCFKTSIGGQAVIEGIMMKGPYKSCLAVRRPDGTIGSEIFDTKRSKIAKIPLIRGVLMMIENMTSGMKYINKSAELSGTVEEEKSRFELWLERVFGEKVYEGLSVIASFLGVALALFLFVFLPTWITGLMSSFLTSGIAKAAVEGVLKILIFVGYLFAVTRIKDIHRVFQYHGAEHKTIHCYESGAELTVENARGFKRFHPRCGTSFIFVVLIVSIIIATFIPWTFETIASPLVARLLRTLIKIACLPVVMGVAYEFIRLAGRYDNVFTRIISAPGMWMQRLTTFEPDDEQLEVAIHALSKVIPEGEADKL